MMNDKEKIKEASERAKDELREQGKLSTESIIEGNDPIQTGMTNEEYRKFILNHSNESIRHDKEKIKEASERGDDNKVEYWSRQLSLDQGRRDGAS